jgi:hypothetical protein
MENIALRHSEITEAWTETGRLHHRSPAGLLEVMVDAKNGAVVRQQRRAG